MGPPSYVRSVVDRNVIMRRVPIYICTLGNWVPVTTAWRLFRLWMEERRPIWRVAANILHKQSRTSDKRDGPPVWELGEMLTTSHRKNILRYGMFTQKASDLD